jgi:hypothetical protein
MTSTATVIKARIMKTLRQLFGAHAAAFAVLIAATLMLRALVPTGWMPSAVPGEIISLCTGSGMVSGWVDAAGKLHTEKQPGKQITEQPCAFAGLTMAADVPTVSAVNPVVFAIAKVVTPIDHHVAIGRGLAAPPPPATGPPRLI